MSIKYTILYSLKVARTAISQRTNENNLNLQKNHVLSCSLPFCCLAPPCPKKASNRCTLYACWLCLCLRGEGAIRGATFYSAIKIDENFFYLPVDKFFHLPVDESFSSIFLRLHFFSYQYIKILHQLFVDELFLSTFFNKKRECFLF